MARLIDADEFMKEIRKWLGNETDFRSLQEIIAGMPTIEAEPVKHGWISVKDRLPEQYSYVIAFTGLEVMEAFYDGWRFGCTSKSHPISVTHWMPLPEPPKDGE